MKTKILVLSAGEVWNMEGNSGFDLEWIHEDAIDESTGIVRTQATISDTHLRAELIDLPGFYEVDLKMKQIKAKNGNKTAQFIPATFKPLAKFELKFPKSGA